MTITWDDSLATGILEVDSQHKELIKKAADLEEAVANNDEASIQNMIQFLEDYVVRHFTDEETAMEKQNYPGLTAQQSAHKNFIQEFSIIKTEYNTNGITPTLKAKLKINVNSWLVSHINSMDKRFGEFMQQQSQ